MKSLPPSRSTAVYRTVQCRQLPTENLGFPTLFPLNAGRSCRSQRSLALFYDRARLKAYTLKPIQAKNDSESSCSDNNSTSFSGTFFSISDSFSFRRIEKLSRSGISNLQCLFVKCFFCSVFVFVFCICTIYV